MAIQQVSTSNLISGGASADYDTLKEIEDKMKQLEAGGITIDKTLTKENVPADSKTVGDKIKNIEENGIASINDVKVVEELDSVDDLKIAGKIVTNTQGAEIFNDYENNKATGEKAHAEGGGTTASGTNAHAEGGGTTASGNFSHAEGLFTKASSNNQHVQGKFNREDTKNKYAFIIGNGTSDSERSNAFAIDWDGNIYINNSETGINLPDLFARVVAPVPNPDQLGG